MRQKPIVAAVLAAVLTVAGIVEAKTLLLSHFDGGSGQGGVNADYAIGNRIASAAYGTSIGAGRFGNALYCTNNDASARYSPAGNIRNDRGTIDFWYIPGFSSTNTPSELCYPLLIWDTRGYRLFHLSIYPDGNVILYSNILPGFGSRYLNFGAYEAGQPIHIAITWDSQSSTVKWFVNGVGGTPVSVSWEPDSFILNKIDVGCLPGGCAHGAIDEFRITDQVEYTDDFTPPTAPYVIDFNAPSSPTTAILTSNGFATAAIVMAPDPTRSAQFAAAELKAHIKQITGADLPTAVDNVAITNGLSILVGESADTRALGYSNTTFGSQEYMVEYTNSALILMGRDADDFGAVYYNDYNTWPDWYAEQGACYAVYDFLERNCGVRWFNPTEFGTVCTNTPTLSVTVPDLRRAPFFKMRGVGTPIGTAGGAYYDAGGATLWPYTTAGFTQFVAAAYPVAGSQAGFDAARSRAARLFLHRMRAGGERNICNHSLYGYYPRFKDSHPDWFAQGWPITNDSQLCYAHTGVIAQLTQDARDYYNGTKTGAELGIFWNPQLPNEFPIEPGDNSSLCKCVNCQAWVNQDASWFFSTSNHSDLVFNFINQVAAALQTTNPGKRIVSLAYASHAALPSRISVNTNVDVQYCFTANQSPFASLEYSYEMDQLQAWGRESFCSGRKLYFWLYPMWWSGASEWGNNYNCFPPYTAHTIAEQFAVFATNNYRGMYYCGWTPEVDAYVNFQLMNNPTQAVDVILNEYFTGMYGPAAGAMSNIYVTIESIFSSPTNYPPEWIPVPHKAIDWGWRGTAERMAYLSTQLALAITQAGAGNVYATNVNLFKIGTWDYMVSGRQDFAQTHTAPTVSIVTPTSGAVTSAPVVLVAAAATANSILRTYVNSGHLSTNWHHVLVTHDAAAGKMELFVDGVLEETAPYLATGARNMDIYIGGRAWNNGVINGYVGYLDEVRVSKIVRNGPATYQEQLSNPPAWDADTALLLHFDDPAAELIAAGGTNYGEPFHTMTGKYNGGLAFNDDNIIYVPNGAFGAEVGTWEAWVYLTQELDDGIDILTTVGGPGWHVLRPNASGGVGYIAYYAQGLNVKFYADDALIGAADSYPYTCMWTAPSIGQHTVKATVTDLYNLSNVSAQVNITVTTNTLVSRWNFENNTTDTAPAGAANNGALKSGMTYNSSDKKLGSRALNFVDTSRQYMSVANQADLNPTGQFTICAWVKPTNWTGNRRILQKGGDGAQYRLYHENSTAKLVCEAKIGGTVKTASIARPSANAWHHVAATYDGMALKLYVDGGTPASTAASGAVSTTTSTLYIGTKTSSSWVTGDYWKGQLDDVRIFKDRALTQDEIQALMGLTQ